MSTNQIDLMKLFRQIKWAEQGDLTAFTETNYGVGWSHLGDDTPTVEDFNAVQQWNDKKDQWLFGQIERVCRENNITVTESGLNALFEAIKRMATQPHASLTQKGLVQLTNDTGLDSDVLALTARAGKAIMQAVAQLQLNTTNALNQKIDKSLIYNGVNFASATYVASANAVKTAFDKAVTANDNANGRVSKNGDTITGTLNIDYGDYSIINQWNTARNQARSETLPDGNGSFYKISYRENNGHTELHSVMFPKRGAGKSVAYEEWVGEHYVPRNGNTVINGRHFWKSEHGYVGIISTGSGSSALDFTNWDGHHPQGTIQLVDVGNYADEFRFYTTPAGQNYNTDRRRHTMTLTNDGYLWTAGYGNLQDYFYSDNTAIFKGLKTFEDNNAFITIKSKTVNWAAIDFKVLNSAVSLASLTADDVGNYAVGVNIFTTPAGQNYNTDRREKNTQFYPDGRIWNKRYGWLDEYFATQDRVNNTHLKSRARNYWFPEHYAGAEVVDLPVTDDGGIRHTWLGVKVDRYSPPYVDIYLPMAYNGFTKAAAIDDGQGAFSYGTEMIGNNIVRVYCRNSGRIGFTLQVVGWAQF